jgi:transcriptional regulator GlxA family with amidase domain
MNCRHIGFLAFPGFQILDLVAMTVFELANHRRARPAYRLELLSEGGGIIDSSSGAQVNTSAYQGQPLDTLIVFGSFAFDMGSPGLVSVVQAAASVARRTASICTGALILAAAGLLDGRRATTHWRTAEELQRRFPSVKVEGHCIYIADGPVWTSAGMTAGIDLSLALVEEDLGIEASRAVARNLLVYHRRPAAQPQISALLELEPRSDRIRNALTFARNHLHESLPVERLAEVARLSPRQFNRTFFDEAGRTPAKAIETLRVEAARARLESGREPIEVIARETGFADPERMRRAFVRIFGQAPQAMRRAAKRDAAPA